ncbi:MAG: FliH/SctL family protein [Planctomycetota bacterium]
MTRVIKAQAGESGLADVFAVRRFEEEAAGLVADARTALDGARIQVREALAQAAAERDRILVEARAQGRREGEAAGHAEGLAKGREEGLAAAREDGLRELEIVRGVLEALVRDLPDVKRRLLGQAETEVVDLAVGIARKILGREVSALPDEMRRRVGSILEILASRVDVRVRVSAEAEGNLRVAYPDLRALFPEGGAVRLAPDATLATGDIVVDSGETTVDARVGEALAEIGRVLLEK